MSRRKSVSGSCKACGVWRETLHRDHIIPKWAGGLNTEDNYQFLCANWHEDKTLKERRSPEGRAHLGECMRKRMLSARARKRISKAVKAANRRRVWTDEMKARVGADRIGVKRPPFTAEHRANMSKKSKGRPWSAAERESRRRFNERQRALGLPANGRTYEVSTPIDPSTDAGLLQSAL